MEEILQQLRLVVYPIIYRVLLFYTSQFGARFLPSTVCWFVGSDATICGVRCSQANMKEYFDFEDWLVHIVGMKYFPFIIGIPEMITSLLWDTSIMEHRFFPTDPTGFVCRMLGSIVAPTRQLEKPAY